MAGPLLQVFSKNVNDTVMDEVFLQFLRLGLEGKGALVAFSKRVLQDIHDITKSSDKRFNFMFNHPILAPIKDGVTILHRLARCLLHFFCVDTPDCVVDPTTDLDVRAITEYAGSCIVTKAGILKTNMY